MNRVDEEKIEAKKPHRLRCHFTITFVSELNIQKKERKFVYNLLTPRITLNHNNNDNLLDFPREIKNYPKNCCSLWQLSGQHSGSGSERKSE